MVEIFWCRLLRPEAIVIFSDLNGNMMSIYVYASGDGRGNLNRDYDALFVLEIIYLWVY